MVDLSEIQAVFIEEAKELVLQFEESLLAMESILPNSDDEIINEAFRAAHTIKALPVLLAMTILSILRILLKPLWSFFVITR